MGRKSAEKVPLIREDEKPSTDHPSRSKSRFDQKNQMSKSDYNDEQDTTTASTPSLSARSLATINLPPDQQGDIPPSDESVDEEDDDDGSQHEEVVDMNQLREIANRLDIPISDLINRIRPQDSQPYDDEEEEAYDYSDEEGDDDAVGGSGMDNHHTSVTVDPTTNIQNGSDLRSSNGNDGGAGFYTDETTATFTPTAHLKQQHHPAGPSYGATAGTTKVEDCGAPVKVFVSTQPPTTFDDQQQPGMGTLSALSKIPFFGRGTKDTTNQYSHQAVPKRSALAKTSSFNTAENTRPSRMRFWESSKNFNSGGGLQEAPKRRQRQGQSVVVSMTGAGSPVSSMGRGEFPTSVSGGSPQDSRKASGLDQSQRASEGRFSASNTRHESPQKAVRFGPPDQLQEVKVFEVDNSLYISIEYSRPVIGWVLLAIGLILRCVSDCIKVFKIGKDFESAYGFSTGAALGDAILCIFLILPLWYFFLRPSKHEKRFLMSWTGMMLLASIGVIGGMTKIAPQSVADITNQWRATALFAIHPAVIVFYGKVFKNSVFIEELLGAIILLGGFCCAMMPIDVLVDKWIFSEVLSFADSIYVASLLFLCVKARSNHVSVPITLASISMCSVALQVIVCAVAGVPFDNSSSDSAFEFARSGATVSIWVASSIGDIISWSCFLVALRFIPPLTVSTTMVLEPLVTHFVSHLLFFNKLTAIWDLCDEDLTPTIAPQPFFSTVPPSPEDAYDGNLGKQIYCSQKTAFSYTFTIGSLICVLAGGYLIYVSSIKRSKVELILKKLRKRKRPKNPYKARGGSRGGSNRSMSSASSTTSNGGGGSNPVLPNPYTDPQEANLAPNPMHQPIIIPIYDELPNVSFSSSSGSNSSSDQSLESSTNNNNVGDYEAPQLASDGSPCSSPDGGSPTRVARKKDKKDKKEKESSSSRFTKDPPGSPLTKDKKGKMDKQEKRSKSSGSPKDSSSSWTGLVGTKRRSAMEAEQENPTVYSSSPKAENHDCDFNQ